MSDQAIIEARGLVKTYPGKDTPAVDGVDLAVRKGSFFGLLGPNGAGKTTLLSMMSGLLKPDGGALRVAGTGISEDLRSVKSRIGLVPQELALYPTLTARENLAFFGSMQGLAGSRLKARVDECLDIANLRNVADARVDTYSGGLKRRLSLVIGLVQEPQVLFLDEPTVGIDPQSRNFIYESLRRMNSSGMTIVYTSHYMEEVEHLCEEIAIIDHGRIIASGRVDELLSRHEYSVVEVRTAGQIPDEARVSILALDCLGESYFNSRGFTLRSCEPQKTLLDVTAILKEHGVRVISMSHGVANLEQLFLALTGTRLRE